MKDVWAFEFQDPTNNQTTREYYLDCFPYVFSSYIKDENKLLGGNLSHRFPSGYRPVVLVGQDEAIFKQWSFSKKSWGDQKGRGVLLPKEDGHGLMLSAFVSWAWGFYSDNEGEVATWPRTLRSKSLVGRTSGSGRSPMPARFAPFSITDPTMMAGGTTTTWPSNLRTWLIVC